MCDSLQTAHCAVHSLALSHRERWVTQKKRVQIHLRLWNTSRTLTSGWELDNCHTGTGSDLVGALTIFVQTTFGLWAKKEVQRLVEALSPCMHALYNAHWLHPEPAPASSSSHFCLATFMPCIFCSFPHKHHSSCTLQADRKSQACLSSQTCSLACSLNKLFHSRTQSFLPHA